MKKFGFLLASILLLPFIGLSQTNMAMSNSVADDVVHGNYDPTLYAASQVVNHTDSILLGIVDKVSEDSLQSYLEHLETFYNRNTGSDTVSNTTGIGAARRWIYSKFQGFGQQNENRLLVSYLDFDKDVCGMGHHKNVLAVLPGADTSKHEILLVEGHYDTRCEGGCDTSCYTPGMDDNGSGTVLVMELARLMSRYTFDRTIVFAATTGEDQGLHGAKALANYLFMENISILAVFNNDVVGGITCGQTSSPPSCPGLNDIDSTNVRVFSYSPYNDSSSVSPHKQLARYVKLHQEERINPLLSTPMNINIILSEDRIGRSGDHIPFRARGYTALRFCSQNEHGDGSGTPPDRQHTTTDILGVDTNVPPDGIIDSFFVDMPYLRRNAISNGVNLGFLAISPPPPEPDYVGLPDGIKIYITGADTVYNHYRVGIRSSGSGSLYFDTVLTFLNTHELEIHGLIQGKSYFFTVMNVENNVESIFPDEYKIQSLDIPDSKMDQGIHMNQNFPNPGLGKTEITIEIADPVFYQAQASILVKDMCGRTVDQIPLELSEKNVLVGLNTKRNLQGIFSYSLVVDGKVLQTRKMVLL